jgi:hypothetical protein
MRAGSSSSIAGAVSMSPSPWNARTLLLAVLTVIALSTGSESARATLTDESFGERTEGQPSLSASGEVLQWEGEDPTGGYLLRRTVPGREPDYAFVRAAHARPPAIAGATVGYRARGLLEKSSSPEVQIAYGPVPLESALLGGLTESDFFEHGGERPALVAAGEALDWEATDPTGAYLIERLVPGREAEYALVRATHARPPAVAGTTVGYRVKGALSSYWSAEVSVDYAATEALEERAEAPEAARSDPTVIVNAAPTGPRAPVGGWHVAYADGFGAPLGARAGQDNFVYPNQNACCNPFEDRHGNNTNELQVYNGNQVRVGSEGLELIDKYAPNRAPAEGRYPVRNYVSGSISTQRQYAAGGWHPFTWRPGLGKTLAFECNCRLPANSPFSGVDPGWWSSDVRWTDEIDFFEEWGWGAGCRLSLLTSCLTGVVWLYDTRPLTAEEFYLDLYGLFDPSTGFHRYTTVIYPDKWSEYIDGQLQRWVGVNGVAPAPPYFTKAPMSLLLTNALRDRTPTSGPNPYPGFSSGTRTFTIRSIAVYEDAAHAGEGISGGGVAPGTSIG